MTPVHHINSKGDNMSVLCLQLLKVNGFVYTKVKSSFLILETVVGTTESIKGSFCSCSGAFCRVTQSSLIPNFLIFHKVLRNIIP